MNDQFLRDSAIYGDHRFISSLVPERIKDIDEKAMTAMLVIANPSLEFQRYMGEKEPDEEGCVEYELKVSLEYSVCPTCQGRGFVQNPSIDAHGLSSEELEEDPDFARDYFAGVFRIGCTQCQGKRVVAVLSPGNSKEVLKEYQRQNDEDRRDAAEWAHQMRMGY